MLRNMRAMVAGAMIITVQSVQSRKDGIVGDEDEIDDETKLKTFKFTFTFPFPFINIRRRPELPSIPPHFCLQHTCSNYSIPYLT